MEPLGNLGLHKQAKTLRTQSTNDFAGTKQSPAGFPTCSKVVWTGLATRLLRRPVKSASAKCKGPIIDHYYDAKPFLGPHIVASGSLHETPTHGEDGGRTLGSAVPPLGSAHIKLSLPACSVGFVYQHLFSRVLLILFSLIDRRTSFSYVVPSFLIGSYIDYHPQIRPQCPSNSDLHPGHPAPPGRLSALDYS